MALIDLSQPLTPGVFALPGLPRPSVELFWCMGEHPANITRIDMIVHCGTHIDAPRHFIAGGDTIDGLPLDCVSGESVGWSVRRAGGEAITVDDLRRNEPELRPGDLLFLDTGWARHYHDDARYADHPHLADDAAAWLVEQGVRLLAIDAPSPDLPGIYRSEGFDWPVHHALLGSGVVVGEHLANLDRVAGRRFRTLAFPLPIVGSDGSPTRFVAEL